MMPIRSLALVVVAGMTVATAGPTLAQPVAPDGHPDIGLFLAAGSDDAAAEGALQEIGARWRDGYAGILWDLAWVVRPPNQRLFRFFSLIGFLGQQTGQSFGPDLARWREWIWDQPYEPHPDYAYFKGQWYSQIDPRFAEFFPRGTTSRIRLDEIDWGGVAVNGIPPLEYPTHVAAAAASYLADDHIVCAVVVSALVAIGTAALKAFKYQENWINYRTTCETLRKEIHFLEAGVGEYRQAEDPFALFVERVEVLISRENTLWLSTRTEGSEEQQR